MCLLLERIRVEVPHNREQPTRLWCNIRILSKGSQLEAAYRHRGRRRWGEDGPHPFWPSVSLLSLIACYATGVFCPVLQDSEVFIKPPCVRWGRQAAAGCLALLLFHSLLPSLIYFPHLLHVCSQDTQMSQPILPIHPSQPPCVDTGSSQTWYSVIMLSLHHDFNSCCLLSDVPHSSSLRKGNRTAHL